MKKFGIKESKNALYWFCLILGLIMIGMAVAKFFVPKVEIPYQLTIAYPIILAAYVAIKEVIRWVNCATSVRLGELLVVLWWGIFILMAVAQFILRWLGINQERFEVPEEMLTICIEVLIIYAISEISKKIHEKKNSKNQKK